MCISNIGQIGQARGFLFFRIVNKFFFRKRKKNKKGNAKRLKSCLPDTELNVINVHTRTYLVCMNKNNANRYIINTIFKTTF